MIFYARATRGLRRVRRGAWPSSCSRNAHDKNVLVRRAQARIDQAPPLSLHRPKGLAGISARNPKCVIWKENQNPSSHADLIIIVRQHVRTCRRTQSLRILRPKTRCSPGCSQHLFWAGARSRMVAWFRTYGRPLYVRTHGPGRAAWPSGGTAIGLSPA